MTDREKLVEGLEELKQRLLLQKDILGYGYYVGEINDVLALLKEQDTVDHAIEVLKAHGWKDDSEVTGDAPSD